MMEKPNVNSFFQKRVLRPSKPVNYNIAQDIPLSPPRKVRKGAQVVTEKENKRDIKEQMQDSHDLTKQLLNGKSVNPFFDKKINSAPAKVEEALELIDALVPDYEDCHVGHHYQRSRGNLFSFFPKMGQVVENRADNYPLFTVDESIQTPKTSLPSINMSRLELDDYLGRHFDEELLQEPCIQALYMRLIESSHNSSSQWNDKYAPTCSEELLGSTNRIYASSLLKYIQEWKQSSHQIRPTAKKVPRNHKLDDIDEFLVSDEDLVHDNVVAKHQLLIGPPGIGKTALVCAVAKEAEMGILEIHSGMKRSGKDLISTLGEATSSRLVGGGKKGTIAASLFQVKDVPKKRRKRIAVNSSDDENESHQNSDLSDSNEPKMESKRSRMNTVLGTDTVKAKQDRASFFQPRAAAPEKKAQKEADLDTCEAISKKMCHTVEPDNICNKVKEDKASFFQPKSKTGIASIFRSVNQGILEATINSESCPIADIKDKVAAVDSISEKNNMKEAISTRNGLIGPSLSDLDKLESSDAQEAKIASARKTLIVLDSVDVLTEQDKGFWNGVATLFQISKKPIILCCNENPFVSSNSTISASVLEFITSSVDLYQVSTPEEDELTCYLSLLLLNEGFLVDPSVIKTLQSHFNHDIRQIILFLQLSTRYDNPVILRDRDAFSFYKIETFGALPLSEVDDNHSWCPLSISDSLDYTSSLCDITSYSDHLIKPAFLAHHGVEISKTTSNSGDFSFLSPPLTDNLALPIETSFKDVQVQLDIGSSISDISRKISNGNSVNISEAAQYLYYEFPKWPFMRERLNDTSNLLFWDGSFQVPRCFITEMLPWVSVLLRNAHMVGQNEGYFNQNGRTRRSRRKVMRFFEGELSDEQYQSLERKWF